MFNKLLFLDYAFRKFEQNCPPSLKPIFEIMDFHTFFLIQIEDCLSKCYAFFLKTTSS